MLNYNYWASEEEKEIIDKRFSENERKKREKYNPDNLFKGKNEIKKDFGVDSINHEKTQFLVTVEYKENLFKKIKKMILKILKKKER